MTHLVHKLLGNFQVNLRCFPKILHSWENFYRPAGPGGPDKSQVCHQGYQLGPCHAPYLYIVLYLPSYIQTICQMFIQTICQTCVFLSFCQVRIQTISLICEDNPKDDVKHCKEGREAFQEELVDSEDKRYFCNISCCFYMKQTVNCLFLYQRNQLLVSTIVGYLQNSCASIWEVSTAIFCCLEL